MSEQMNAAFIEEYGELTNVTTGELPKPEAGEGEVLVRVKSAGVNPVDAAVVRGMLKDAIPGEFPLVPGWDVAGVVEETGHSVSRFSTGDEVYAYARRPKIQHGTYAEYISLPESYLAERPTNISMEASGGIPLVGLTAYQSIFDFGELKEGQTLLILGASGGVGTLAIQLAKSVGAKVIGVASESNHEYMKELGADITIDYNDNHVGEAVKEAQPDGVDLIFHCSRGDSFSQVMETGVLKEGGKVASITNSNPEISDDIEFKYVFVEPNAEQLEHITVLADSGKITVPVTDTFSLEEAGEALQKIESLHTRGKLVITP
ncbi:MAG: NADP-dependent oxidoreductase [Gracilimonas sp.]|uniref:NADP-dependent oxidoreductase n=1 Tax=Gracilimonas TaxID=649462 RepID=UPI001B2697BE|nr:NADP-dependent oxidoreductase [Gracilimonas sp.]MBO6585102.1 NADP-dependent oxidoreductase [Gracilimonas sp.]MBO6615627.1 NADP-dependent oxidoreductase [Gracilimonas sp.]